MTARTGIFAAARPRIFSIAPGRPFVDDLARALRAETGGDPAALADCLIFTPTRRAVRALADAFVRTAPDARASLLPRIRALGDVDEDEFLLHDDAGLDDAGLPPAASSLERRMVLARLVAAAEKAFAGQENWPGAIAAAGELGKLLDSFYAEEIDFARLYDLSVIDQADHWDNSLKFLKIATEAWPGELKRNSKLDPAERRAKLIDLQTKLFEKEPPQTPVIVAGTTGSAPAVARLMKVVASLPHGAVVLPGLDLVLASEKKAWDKVNDPHPQMGLKALLGSLGAAPADIAPWPDGSGRAARETLLSLALRPAEATDDWRGHVEDACKSDPKLEKAAAGMSLVEAAGEEEEAAAVALVLREALETPGRTAMLVTPDRDLGRRVAAKMRRWGVALDDSAGVPFANTPCGIFLRLTASWLAEPGDAVAALSLAKHSLAGFALGPAARKGAVSALDRGLRGVSPGPGIDGLARKLAADRRLAERAEPIIVSLKQACAGWPGGRAPFTALLDAHIAAAESLAGDTESAGADRLWRGDDGDIGAALLADLRAIGEALGDISAADYADAFTQFIAGASVRRRAPAHPRLSILGPLEARLISADVVILGGLNEGVWPADAPVDPFLSRAMRKDVGLPSPERRLGLAAHDFAQLAAAPTVVMTRARMAGGAPAKPSRWIIRLRNILAGAGALGAVDQSARLATWTASLDHPDKVTPVTAPKPTPPLDARPRKLAVTRFEKLMRDPYAIYAQYVLCLKALNPVAEALGARELGSLLHKVFETFVLEGCDPAAPEASARLRAILEGAAADYGLDAAAMGFQRARLLAALGWFLEWDRAERAVAKPAVIEGRGAHAFKVNGKEFTLTARADRIDLGPAGAALYDYKSGALPTFDQMKANFSPQLALTALIVEAGGFEALGPVRVASFQFVKALNQTGKAKDDFSGAEGAEARALIDAAREGFEKLVGHFDDPETPYISQPRPQFMDVYGDYDHLARRREWAIAEEAE